MVIECDNICRVPSVLQCDAFERCLCAVSPVYWDETTAPCSQKLGFLKGQNTHKRRNKKNMTKTAKKKKRQKTFTPNLGLWRKLRPRLTSHMPVFGNVITLPAIPTGGKPGQVIRGRRLIGPAGDVVSSMG
uniref:Uncharacterized protein n=1 Tax=Ixodes ricinus TaxID=34613 RepID=A0A6B0USD9_IXORI